MKIKLYFNFSFVKQYFGNKSICLENIDSNKIRGEGVYNDPAPLRSAGSYFYILQLFSTEPDGCSHCCAHFDFRTEWMAAIPRDCCEF